MARDAPIHAALLLNVWLVVALAVPVNAALEGDQTHAWSQTLAWLAGSALPANLLQKRTTASTPAAHDTG